MCVMGAGVCLCLCVRGEGRTIWVDGERGDNSKTGSETEPVKTIGKGVSVAVAGDEVVVKAGKGWGKDIRCLRPQDRRRGCLS